MSLALLAGNMGQSVVFVEVVIDGRGELCWRKCGGGREHTMHIFLGNIVFYINVCAL